MPLSVGDKLGPYEILALIGKGGMGEVYRAHDPRLRRDVAIKISTERFSERFQREAHAVAALNHPNICSIYDVGPNYLVMELVEGAPLRGPLAIEEAVKSAGQILDALDAAHRKGIVHRDLKPQNILLTKLGIKLLDFGLARVAMSPDDSTLTVPGAVMGTPAYMAPEQWEGKSADARSDIYAFGCVLYEMLTGKRVGPERIPVEPLERIIKRCLSKDPDHRYQTAIDLKAALAWAMEQPLPTRPDRHWPWIAAASIVLAGFGGWAVSRLLQTSTDKRVLRFQIDPPEGGRFVFGNGVGGIAISPDGRTAAYIAAVSGTSGLWVHPLDGTSGRFLAGTEGAADPFWSPDSKTIGFVRGRKLQRVDLAGGAPLTICDADIQRGGAWLSDDRILIGSTTGGLLQVPSTGGTPSPLTTLDASRAETAHRWPHALPGGRFLYWARSSKPESTGIFAASLAKPTETVHLVTTDANALYAPGDNGKAYLLWLRGGTLVAQEFDTATLRLAGEPHPVTDPVARVAAIGNMNATVSDNGLLLYSSSNTFSQFAWLDRTGTTLGAMAQVTAYTTFRLSPDGRRAVTTRDNAGGNDLWLLEVERGASDRFTSASALNQFPIWSPDGRTIVFSSTGSLNLFRKPLGGETGEQQVTQSPNYQLPNDWSRDGLSILYFEITPGTQRDLWYLPVTPDGKAAPGAQPKPYVRTQFNESYGRFSPETHPRWVAYQSDDSGRYEIHVQAFPKPHNRSTISVGGGTYPQWSPDGREMFYVSPENKLMAVRLKVGTDSVEASPPQVLFSLPVVDTGFPPYDVAPDGKRFLVRVSPRTAPQPLTVIVNWPALLKKAVASP